MGKEARAEENLDENDFKEDDDECEGDQESDEEVEEYTPDEDVSDDEDTIEKDEQSEQKDEFEINMLENEAEVPMEELLKMYYPEQWKGERRREAGEMLKLIFG